MKSKILLPVIGFAILGGIALYNPKVFSTVKSEKMSASVLLEDNPNLTEKKVINPFPKDIQVSTVQIFNEDIKTPQSIREILKNQLQILSSKHEIPKEFDCREITYEVDIHNQKTDAPRYDMKYSKEVNAAEELVNYVGMYEVPFVFTQLYHRNNITLTPAKGKYLYEEHFPEKEPEQEAYLVRKVSHLLPIFDQNNEIKYLHFSVYARHVERGVYETYENFVIKYNEDGTISHVINFSKNHLNWVKMNYDTDGKATYADNITLNRYTSSSRGAGIHFYHYRINIKHKV